MTTAELIAEAERLGNGVHAESYLYELIDRLTQALRESEATVHRNALDWAQDNSAIKSICASHGIDTEGDSYGVPTMVDCVEQMEERLRNEVHQLETTNAMWEASYSLADKERDQLQDLVKEVLAYRKGEGRYNFSKLPDDERSMASLEAWEQLEWRLEQALAEDSTQTKP